jgi:tetratricopeptide (TPR) repeat protein
LKKAAFLAIALLLATGFNGVYAQHYDHNYGHANPGSGYQDLKWAKSLMERGDYVYAAEKFADIARSSLNSEKIRKEAMYYLGYCHVKNNDPWQAIRVYERFLDKYDDGINEEFIPDALYVLGRVYEETSDNRNAIKVYRRCIRNYPRSQYARKSRERMKMLGQGSGSDTDPFDGDHNDGGYHDDDYANDHHGDGSTGIGISREIRQLLRIAKTVNNSYTRDQMLLEGADRARTGEDFVALAKAIENDFTRSQIFDKVKENRNYSQFSARSMLELAGFINNSYLKDQFLVDLASDFAKRDYVSSYDFVDISAAMNNDMMRQQLFDAVAESSAFRFMSARTVADLANTCKNSYIHDQFLLTAAQKLPFGYRDCRILAEAASNSFTKTQIMQEAKDGYDSHHGGYHGRRTAGASDNSTRAIPPEAPTSTDPFADFKFNKAQISRIAAFIKAVDNKKGMQKAASKLKKADLYRATVREYMEKFRTMQNFENIHRNR